MRGAGRGGNRHVSGNPATNNSNSVSGQNSGRDSREGDMPPTEAETNNLNEMKDVAIDELLR